MQLSLRASHLKNSHLEPEFWAQLGADSGRTGHLGRGDSGSCVLCSHQAVDDLLKTKRFLFVVVEAICQCENK
jgi:hypothetical protein